MTSDPRELAPSADEITDCLLAGDPGPVERLFAAHDASAPEVIWNPGEADLPHEPLQFLLGYWSAKKDGNELPRTGSIDPVEMKPALRFIMLLDVLDGGTDFRYRVYGTGIVERTGRDWTGKRVSDLAAFAYTGRFYTAVYRAALRRRLTVATVSDSPRHVAATDWSRLVLPLANKDGEITRFLVGNVPGVWRKPE